MAEEIIKARVWTKVDTLENWNNNPLLLGPGEMALVTTPSGIPLNMKWGDKTKRRRFSDLPFAISYDQGQFVAIEGPGELPTPESDVAYSLVGPGTYTYPGQADIVVDDGRWGQVVYNDGEWSLVDMGELPDKSTVFDVNRYYSNNDEYEREEARQLVPESLRRNGMVLQYNTNYGVVFEQMISDEWSFTDNSYVSLNTYFDKIYTESADRRIFYKGGSLRFLTGYNARSKYFRILESMTFYNYSVLTTNRLNEPEDPNLFAAFFIFDRAFNFLGTLNETTSGTFKGSRTIPLTEVTSQFPRAYYISVNVPINRGFSVVSNTAQVLESYGYEDYEQKTFRGEDFDRVGYIHKLTGVLTFSTSYLSTGYLKYLGGNLVVSGFSGSENNSSLLAMYDKDFNFLGSLNREEFGNIYNETILESELHPDTRYVRSNGGNNQTDRYIYGNLEVQDYIEKLQDTSTGTPDNIFKIADTKVRVNFNNYLGNSQNIHPKILYFKTPWNGYRYWMAYTPYPQGATETENPAIVASNNGLDWVLPAGAPNPLDVPPAGGYNSDTHLVYREDLDRIEVFYRPYITALALNQIKRRVSYNGSDWEDIELIIDTDGEQMLSPAIMWEDGIYKWWWCGGGDVYYGESTDSNPGVILNKKTINVDWGVLHAWHIDVISTDLGYEWVVQCWEPGEGNNSSDLYYVLEKDDGSTSKPELIIHRGELSTDFDNVGIYRATVMKINGFYFVYYSALYTGGGRAIGMKCGRNILDLR